jgi:hypothetical protein
MRMRDVPFPPRTGETARVREVVAGALRDADVPSVGETARMREGGTVAGAVTVAELAMLPANSPVWSAPVALPPVVTGAVCDVPGTLTGAIGLVVTTLVGGVAVPLLTLTRPVPLLTVATFGLTSLDEETVGLTTNALRETGEGIVDEATVVPARPLETFAVTVGVAPAAGVAPVPAIVSGAETPAPVVTTGVALTEPVVAVGVVVVPFVVTGTKPRAPPSSMTASVPAEDSDELMVDCGFTAAAVLMSCPVWGSSTTTVPLGAGSDRPRYFIWYSLRLFAGSLARYALIIGAFPPLNVPSLSALYALVMGAFPPP